MLFLIMILTVLRRWHGSSSTFVWCWSRPHTHTLSPWCQLLPSEPRVYWVYLLRLWPNHIYPTVFAPLQSLRRKAWGFSLFHPLLPVPRPLLCPVPPSLTCGDRQCTMWPICNCERAVMATVCSIQEERKRRGSKGRKWILHLLG